MLGLAALILAAAASPSPALASASPWWEKFTFTYDGDGSRQSCRYQTSLAMAPAAAACNTDEPDSNAHQARASTGSYTKISIERRYTPGLQPEPVKLATGDTLLGGQVMALAIDGAGTVRSCRVVGQTGDVKAPYGCAEARGERFEASAGHVSQLRHGFMTVLVYGHEEYPV